jgi:hypothetical protein
MKDYMNYNDENPGEIAKVFYNLGLLEGSSKRNSALEKADVAHIGKRLLCGKFLWYLSYVERGLGINNKIPREHQEDILLGISRNYHYNYDADFPDNKGVEEFDQVIDYVNNQFVDFCRYYRRYSERWAEYCFLFNELDTKEQTSKAI